jgi:folate-binding protein YgfZ
MGFFERNGGLIEVSGGEAVMFLNGLITNDVAKFEFHTWKLAAFPNAQGRLLAVVRVLRTDDGFLFETEETTHEKVLKNLERFVLAGDFKVRDLTAQFSRLSIRGRNTPSLGFKTPVENEVIRASFGDETGFITRAFRAAGFDVLVPKDQVETFTEKLKSLGAIPIGEKTREVLRIENGVPEYGVDMDETTVVLETGLDEAVSFTKGCYIGQEIIARIHFRGHVAKQLTGLILEGTAQANDELKSAEGKSAGKITSVAFSPKFEKNIAIAFVRYDYLAEGTELKVNDSKASVTSLPFVS